MRHLILISLIAACGDDGAPVQPPELITTVTLDFVRVLAGYTTTRSGRQVWFAFMLNGCGNGLSCRAAIDRAVIAIASYTG